MEHAYETHGRMSEDSEQRWMVIKIPEDDDLEVLNAERSENFPKYKKISDALYTMTLKLKVATYESKICKDLDEKVESLTDQIVKLEDDTLTFLDNSQRRFTGMTEAYKEYLQYFNTGEVVFASASLLKAIKACSEVYQNAEILYTAYQTNTTNIRTIYADMKTKRDTLNKKEELEEAKRSHESNENEAKARCQELQNQMNKEEIKRTRAETDLWYGLVGGVIVAACVIASVSVDAPAVLARILHLIVGMISMFWLKWLRDLNNRKTEADSEVEKLKKDKEAESIKAMMESTKKTEAEQELNKLTKEFPRLNREPGAVKELREAIDDLISLIKQIEFVMKENKRQWKMMSDAVRSLKDDLVNQSKHVDNWKEMPKDEVMARLRNDSHNTFMKARSMKLCTFVAHRKYCNQCKQSLQKRLDEMNELQTDNPTHEEALEKNKTGKEELQDLNKKQEKLKARQLLPYCP